MFSQRFKWNLPDQGPPPESTLLEAYPKILRDILFQRNITSEQEAIDYLLPKNLEWYSSVEVLHTEKSSQLIVNAIETGERIAIYGDYDADGLTSTALLYLALNKYTDNLIPYIPHRFTEGYGLNKSAIQKLHQKDVSLIITVDNGISSIAEVEYANSLGMTVIITDHHSPKTELPPAAAIMNPKAIDDFYPFKKLAGVGVTYKLVASLSKYLPSIIPEDYLDLVAIGTIADIVPLIGENRYLAKQGLASINQFNRQSLVSLLGAANLIRNKIRSSDISYQIGPRLNAAGRLGQADTALNLLLSSDPKVCGKLAQQLENDNFNRKKISRLMEERALEIIHTDQPRLLLISAFDKDFHSGVSGIVAGSLARKFNLPVIIGKVGDEYSVASCRSIPDFDLFNALNQCKDLFVRFGGHSQAAGFTIKNSNLFELNERLLNIASKKLSGVDLTPRIDIDAEVLLGQLDAGLIDILEKFEPTGAENQEVVFLGKELQGSRTKTVGQDNDHLKMVISDGIYSFDAIGFGMGDQMDLLPPKFDALFNFQLNEFRGKTSFQLNLLDLRKS